MKQARILRIGIASIDTTRDRMMAIARGECIPAAYEPKIWFSSEESLARVLSTRNQLLLEVIAQSKPHSMSELTTNAH